MIYQHFFNYFEKNHCVPWKWCDAHAESNLSGKNTQTPCQVWNRDTHTFCIRSKWGEVKCDLSLTVSLLKLFMYGKTKANSWWLYHVNPVFHWIVSTNYVVIWTSSSWWPTLYHKFLCFVKCSLFLACHFLSFSPLTRKITRVLS